MPLADRLRHLPTDARGYPIIVTVPQPSGAINFGALSERRKLVVATYDLCSVCGHPFADDDLRRQVQFATEEEIASGGKQHAHTRFNEAPVHRICALYASQVCPFVSSPHARHSDQLRRGQRRGQVLVLRGFRSTADVKAITSELQPDVSILGFEMGELAETVVLPDAASAQQAYSEALEDDGPVQLDVPTAVLVEQLSTTVDDGEDASSVMAGGAYVVGAGFLRGVDKLQGMSRFGAPDSPYATLSALLAHDALTEDGLSDPHMLAAIRWLRTRDELPPLLAKWREHGRRTTRLRGAGGPVAPGARRGPDPAKRRKPQRAARRKNRR